MPRRAPKGKRPNSGRSQRRGTHVEVARARFERHYTTIVAEVGTEIVTKLPSIRSDVDDLVDRGEQILQGIDQRCFRTKTLGDDVNAGAVEQLAD